MKKVFFVIPTLHGGGAERVMVNILRYIDRSKFKPNLVLFVKKGELLSEIPQDVRLLVLNSRWLVPVKLAGLLRKERPDAVVSFMWYANLIILITKMFSGINCKLAASERSTFLGSNEGRVVEFFRRLAARYFYPMADAVIVNSKNMGAQLKQLFKIVPEKIKVIYNPIDLQEVKQFSGEEIEHLRYMNDMPVIVGIGRLSREKGFDYLINAVHILKRDGVNCRLIMLGNGTEKKKLKDLASKLQIHDRVDFPGFQKNPYKYLSKAAVFVLSSLYEGFPNALLEALALGVPSIATRCSTGPEEIITDGVNGILVPPADDRKLADAIKRLLLDEGLRKRLGEAGKKRAEDFRVEKIIKQYEDVIEAICAESAVK